MEEKSPCINVCRYDDNGMCIGCLRKVEEISNWLYYSNDEKKRIKEDILKRRLERGENYYGGPS